jgi:hypothetical protein
MPDLVFLGTMAAKHNVAAASWIIEELVPKLKQRARIVFVGWGTSELPLPSKPALVQVEYMGEVEDLAPVLEHATLCLAPLLSSAGPKTKVLDYVAAGCRVLGTPIAYEGLEGCPGFITATLDQFPDMVNELLANAELPEAEASRRAEQAEWLRRQHGIDRTSAQWRGVLEQVGLVEFFEES